MKIYEVFSKVDPKESMALVKDDKVSYIVMNTKMNMIDFDWINNFNAILD